MRFDPDRLELWIDQTRIAARGMILVNALPAAAQAMRQREFTVRLDLKAGGRAVHHDDLRFQLRLR